MLATTCHGNAMGSTLSKPDKNKNGLTRTLFSFKKVKKERNKGRIYSDSIQPNF